MLVVFPAPRAAQMLLNACVGWLSPLRWQSDLDLAVLNPLSLSTALVFLLLFLFPRFPAKTPL